MINRKISFEDYLSYCEDNRSFDKENKTIIN